jgi:hypothetical protein
MGQRPSLHHASAGSSIERCRGDDARVNATIPTAEDEMKELGKSFTAKIYEGANLKAAQQAWPATVAFFRERLN